MLCSVAPALASAKHGWSSPWNEAVAPSFPVNNKGSRVQTPPHPKGVKSLAQAQACGCTQPCSPRAGIVPRAHLSDLCPFQHLALLGAKSSSSFI